MTAAAACGDEEALVLMLALVPALMLGSVSAASEIEIDAVTVASAARAVAGATGTAEALAGGSGGLAWDPGYKQSR